MEELKQFLTSFQDDMEDKMHYYRLEAEELLYDGLPQETYMKLLHHHIIELRGGDGYRIFSFDAQKATPASNYIANILIPQQNEIQKFKAYSL
jgi:hypothetical protein